MGNTYTKGIIQQYIVCILTILAYMHIINRRDIGGEARVEEQEKIKIK